MDSNKVKADWLKALRSGKYKQCTGRLRNSANQFCCLGVLADVALDGEWTDTLHYRFKDAPTLKGTIPSTVWTGELGWNVSIMDTLVSMNDRGDTFGHIADYIEDHL